MHSISSKKNKIVAIIKNSGDTPTTCRNIDVQYDKIETSLLIKWEDVLSDWYGGTTVVINEEKFPFNETDGSIIYTSHISNQFKETPLVIPVMPSHYITTYRIGLFPYSSTLNYNRLCSKLGQAEIKVAVPRTLSNSTWREIADISEAGLARDAFTLGDTKTILLADPEDYAITSTILLRLIAFDYFTIFGTSKKAGICLMGTELPTFYSGKPADGNYLNISIYLNATAMQSDAYEVVKDVHDWYTTGSNTFNQSNTGKSKVPFIRPNEISFDGTGFEWFNGKTKDDLKLCVAGTDIPTKWLINRSDNAFGKCCYVDETGTIIMEPADCNILLREGVRAPICINI